MIIKGKSIDAAITRPSAAWRMMLFYGPDEGLVHESAARAARAVVADLADPFRVAQLSGAELKTGPARLHDEAAALSMTGGRRVLRLRGVSDANAGLIESFLATGVGDALVVAEAGELPKASKLRKLFEAAENAAIIACYSDSGGALRALISDTLLAEGFTLSRDALAYLSDNLAENRMITRNELEKLVLFMGPGTGGEIGINEARACIGDQGAQGFDEICDAAGAGNLADLDRALSLAFAANLAPVAIVRAAANHLLRLQLLAAQTSQGRSVEAAIGGLRPPVHFSRADSLRAQANKWTLPRTSRALEILLDAETNCKTTGQPDLAICSRALMQLAGIART